MPNESGQTEQVTDIEPTGSSRHTGPGGSTLVKGSVSGSRTGGSDRRSKERSRRPDTSGHRDRRDSEHREQPGHCQSNAMTPATNSTSKAPSDSGWLSASATAPVQSTTAKVVIQRSPGRMATATVWATTLSRASLGRQTWRALGKKTWNGRKLHLFSARKAGFPQPEIVKYGPENPHHRRRYAFSQRLVTLLWFETQRNAGQSGRSRWFHGHRRSTTGSSAQKVYERKPSLRRAFS